MNYATIKYYDIANGPGVRTSIFVSGCRHHCPGCFNEVAWDFGYGQPFDKAVRNEIFASCQPDYIAGISLLGGEPFEPENQRELLPFVRNFRALYPDKSVWCYSGYTWEQLTGSVPCPARCEVTDELLSLLDVLVDGRLWKPSTISPCASGAAPISGFWMCQEPCRKGPRLVGGRTGVCHTHDVILSVALTRARLHGKGALGIAIHFHAIKQRPIFNTLYKVSGKPGVLLFNGMIPYPQ